MLEQYHKQALSFEQQLERVSQRGLVIADKDAALAALSSISYYRLSAYWYPFRIIDQQGKRSNEIIPETRFEDVIELYEFDRQLRLLVMDAIERIEVAIRTSLTYHMGQAYGAFAHTDPKNFHPKFEHRKWLAKLEAETSRSSDEFIRHFRSHYHGFPTIPVWMVTEVMSLGALSFFYNGLRNDLRAGVEDKKLIAAQFDIHHKRLGNWLHILTYIRNVCAHHSRLWNRELAIRPDANRDPNWLNPITPRNDRIFYILLMLRHLLKARGNNSDWQRETTTLLKPIAAKPHFRKAMGMPENWKEHPLWA